MITTLIKNTFLNLNQNGLKATPYEYNKAFCDEAKKLGNKEYIFNEVDMLQEGLSQKNSSKLQDLNIKNIDELLTHIENSFENSMSNEELHGLLEIVRNSLRPSLGTVVHDEIETLNNDIKQDPKQLLDTNIQTKMHDLFKVRCELDKKAMTSQTKQLVKMLKSVANEFTNTLNVTNSSNDKVLEIRENIVNLNTESINDQDIENIKDQMLSVTKTFEEETSKFTKNLEKNSTTIDSMTKRIETLEKNLKEAKQDSITDFMTGLMTRRGFEQYIDMLDESFISNKEEYCAVFFDIDHFKKVNDTYGHDAGDSILITFAKLLKIETLNVGEVFRFGGEEFVAIFPKKNLAESLEITERIRKRVEKSKFIHENLKLKITFSAGIAQRSEHSDVDTLISSADGLLYKAKQEGRNRVVS